MGVIRDKVKHPQTSISHWSGCVVGDWKVVMDRETKPFHFCDLTALKFNAYLKKKKQNLISFLYLKLTFHSNVYTPLNIKQKNK